MAKISQTFKEIIQIVIFLAVVGLLLTTFVIYPLNRTKALAGREAIDDYDADSLGVNDPTPFLEAGFAVDTFYIEADGVTSLACAYLTQGVDTTAPDETFVPRGTALLAHDEGHDRLSMLPLARMLVDSGFAVVVYDQRATGLTSGEYHGDGQYEATDLAEIVPYLALRDQLTHPFVAVGYGLGADASILASAEESRMDAVVAIEPYLSTERWLNVMFDRNDTFWIPFRHTVFWFWYDLRSGYAAKYRGSDQIQGLSKTTLVLAPQEALDSPEYATLAELTASGLLTTGTRPADESALLDAVVKFAMDQLPAPATE